MRLHSKRVLFTVLLSLAVHLSMMAIVLFAPQLLPYRYSNPITVEILDPSTQSQTMKSTQVVSQSETPKENLAPDNFKPKVVRLSETTQRVKEERMRSGETPRPAPPSPPSQRENSQYKESPQNQREQSLEKPKFERPSTESGLASREKPAEESRPRDPPGMFSRNFVSQESGIPDYVPNVRAGGFAALNTDQFTFFTFYERIKPAIRYNWVRGINEIQRGSSLGELSKMAQEQRITHVQVTLNSKGYLEEVLVLRSSGFAKLDDAVVQAFQKATPFLNPPAPMADEDGKIRFTYGFYLQLEPYAFSRR